MSYKLALIGCGRIGVWLEDDPLRAKPASHMGGITRIIEQGHVANGLELVAACDLDGEKLSRFQTRFGLSPSQTYQDYKELISIEKPDIAVIATWTASHRDIAVYAAQHGVKGIVLEKPTAVSLDQAQEIVATCQREKVKLVVNHERRWDPLFRKTKEIIENKDLGELKLINGNVLSQSAPIGPWESVLDEAGGGPLLHDGTHLIDMIRYFAGDIATISGHVSRHDRTYGTETTATAFLRSVNGVNIFIEAGGMREYFNFEMDLQFERGRIKIGNGICDYYTAQNSNRYSGFKDLIKTAFPTFPRDTHPFTGAILELIHAMETDAEPLSSGEDATRAMEIIFGIYYSAYLNGKPVTLPLTTLSGHPLKKMFRTGMI
ncbi:MAG: Gfo/Idh/MocA family protein [Candidatus Omnitrophota bacterium]